MKKIVLVLGIAALLFASCVSAPSSTNASKEPDLTGVTSYYVRADGNDSNVGTSEDKPFKTLAKAVQAASKTTVKKITVIGTVEGKTTTKGLNSVPSRQRLKIIDAVGAKDISKIVGDNIGVAQLKDSYDTPLSHEILITGKSDATSGERAILTSKTSPVLIVENAAVRLEYIEISECKGEGSIWVLNGDLTVAKGVKITRNTSKDNGVGIYVEGGTLIMRDDAEVSFNEGVNAVGICFQKGSVGILLDNARITDNKAGNLGGGIGLYGSTLIMKDNATISSNSAVNFGGGILAGDHPPSGFISQITISGNASIIKNNARIAGGIAIGGATKLILQDTARVTENTATQSGGGIFGEGENVSVTKGPNVILKNNKAPQAPDTNFNFN